MSYTVIARRYRPQTFDELVGQGHVTTTLKRAFEAKRIHHAYLFAGPRGVGKTSTARILAKALSCEKGPRPDPCNRCRPCEEIARSAFLDVFEIDGASNRGIDEIRALRENVKYAPAAGRYKIYIIDEVHQITRDAFNALLKTLEEPPAHVRFIFATTEPHRLPATILSRCQRFDFRLVDVATLVALLKDVAAKEKIKVDEKALYRVARAAGGSVRDAESILDQLVNFSKGAIGVQDVNGLLGLLDNDFWFRYLDAVHARDVAAAWGELDRVLKEGADPYQFGTGLSDFLRDLLVARLGEKVEFLLELAKDEARRVREFAARFKEAALIRMIDQAGEAQEVMRRALSPRLALEVLTVKLARGAGTISVDEILDRLEGKSKGEPPPPPVEPSAAPKEKSVPLVKVEPAVSGAPLDEAQVRGAWPGVISRIKEKKISLGACLDEAVLAGVKGRALLIGLPKGHIFQKENLERREHDAILRQAFEEALGAPVRIELELGTGARPAPDASDAKKQAPHPIVESAMRLFGGRVTHSEQPS